MPAITSLGIGSGMDINSIVSQLVALQRQPIRQLQTVKNQLETRVSSFGQIQSLFSGLQDASSKLSSFTLWNSVSATSANTAAVKVSGTNGAAAGSYSVSVQSLAASQNVVSQAALSASTDLVGEGSMTIELGQWGAGTPPFTPADGSGGLTIAVDATDTLATLRDKINEADAGVTASIVTDANGARLAIRSKETGLANGFRIGVSDTDGVDAQGLSRFAYDPPAGAQMTLAKAAANAQAVVNGVAIESASNKLTGAVENLEIELLQPTTSEVAVTVSQDKEAIGKAVADFAKAYSDLAKYIRDQTKYDADKKTGGPLQGDSTANGLMGQLRAIVNTPSGASTTFTRLSELGLELQADGSMKVAQSKLDAAMTNLPELQAAFSNRDEADPANDGFAQRFAQLASQVTGAEGSLTTRTEGLRARISQNGKRQDQLNDRVALYEKRLVAQYGAMDANLAKLNALSGFVSQQLTSLSNFYNVK